MKIKPFWCYKISFKIKKCCNLCTLYIKQKNDTSVKHIKDLLFNNGKYSFYYVNSYCDKINVELKCDDGKNNIYDIKIKYSMKLTEMYHMLLYIEYYNTSTNLEIIDPNNVKQIKFHKNHKTEIDNIYENSGKYYYINVKDKIKYVLDKKYMYCFFICMKSKNPIYLENNNYDILGNDLMMISSVNTNKDKFTLCGDNFKIIKIGNKLISNNPNILNGINVPKYYDIMIIIAFQDRHEILEKNIKSLKLQITQYTFGIILIGSLSDRSFTENIKSKYENVYCLCIPNNPCGAKWQMGVYYSRLFNPKSIVILGSDDILSKNYLEVNHKYILDRYDLVGKRSWYTIKHGNKNLYDMSYTNKIKITLGSGRMYSKIILDKINWLIFDFLKDRGLDNYGEVLVNKNYGKILCVNDESSVLSVKGNWEQMNNFDSLKQVSLGTNKRINIIEYNDHENNERFIVNTFGHNFYDILCKYTCEELLINLKNIN